MLQKPKRSLVILALLSSAACGGDPVSPRDTSVTGSWYETNQVVGSSTVLELIVLDTLITGTGTSTLEAGPSYVLRVTGVVTASRLDLDFARPDGTVGHFRGHRAAPDSIAGSLYYTGLPFVNDPAPTTFVRVVPLKL